MHRDAGVGALLALLGGVLLRESGKIPFPPLVPIGPAFYPRIILGIFIALSLCLVVSGLIQGRVARTWNLPAWLKRYRLFLLCFLIFGLYALALPRFGFLLSTFLFTVVIQWVLGRRGGRGPPGGLGG